MASVVSSSAAWALPTPAPARQWEPSAASGTRNIGLGLLRAPGKPPAPPPGSPLGKRHAGGDERVGILAPDLLLGPLVAQGQHPVMDGEVGHVPAGGGAAARDLGGDVEHRHERQLHAAPALGLVEA